MASNTNLPVPQVANVCTINGLMADMRAKASSLRSKTDQPSHNSLKLKAGHGPGLTPKYHGRNNSLTNMAVRFKKALVMMCSRLLLKWDSDRAPRSLTSI